MAKVFSTSKFESMSNRPPTPPKDLHDEDQDADIALQFLEDPFGTKTHATKAVANQSLLSTPEQSPSSEIGSVSSAESSRKRVSFIQTCIAAHKGLSPAQYTPRHSSPLRPLPQTRVLKPLKSILKAYDLASTPPQPDQSAAAHEYTSFADMLESIVKLLAQPARASRLDAYINLTKTMQAYDRVPDVASLVSKMGLLSQFIQRDMQAISIGGTGPDSQLISQALRLLMALVRVPELKTHMDDAFCSFVIDRIILVTADPDMPKTIVNTHLALLMQQTFRPKTMTLVRVEKILDVLDNIPERVSGNSVHAYRLRVFRKLVQQRGDVMIKHTERWFKPTVAAMLSPQKDINQSALDMAISASKLLGSDHHVSKSVLAVLNREKTDGNTVGKVVAQQLEKMLSTESASVVPQIWAAVTALLSDSLQGTAFTALREWLTLLQRIISSPHELVRIHANVAFCFLVYALKISAATPQNWSRILRDIPQHQLQRQNQPKKAELDAATSGYFTLLYYSFQPAASHAQLDRYWEEFVAGFWRPFLQSPSPKHAVAACRVVSALLRGSRRPWDEQRALDFKSQLMIQREELPKLDPKWVRKTLSTMLEFVETLLDITPWTPDVGVDESVKTMWVALLDSLVEASSKEIMASTETKDAIAHIVNLLRRMWDKHTEQLAMAQQNEDTWAEKFCFLVETVVQKLGAFQFADKCLTRNAQDDFEVAPTPSHRSRQHGPRISPLLLLVELIVSQSEGKLSDTVRLQVVELVLEPCLKVQNTRLGKLDLLKDCSGVVDPASKSVVAFNFWGRIATLTKSCIEEQPSDSNERVSRQLGKEYEAVVDILALGSSYILYTPRGQEVLSTFIDTVKREAGDGAVVLAVVEQVSKRVLQRVALGEDSRACLPYTSTLLISLPPTISRRVLDQAKQNLSPSSPTPARNAEFEPYKEFYTALVSVGLSTYRDMDINDVESTRDFLAALATSIQNYPISLLAVYLRKIQEFVSFWIADADKKLQQKDQQIKDLHSEVVILWQTISGAIERLPKKDSQLLTTLEPLLTAGFVSRRRGIVNISINSWNATFGKESSLRYPSRLEEALQRLRNTVELSVPSLPAAVNVNDGQITFYESDTDVVEPVKKVRTPRVKESPFRISKATRKTRSPAVKTLSPAISRTPVGSRRTSSRLTPKVRLRHDDSQIQFEPITSSPTNPFTQESQILTERQKEMIERQRINANIFADLRSTPRRESTASMPHQSHLDATGADDLPTLDTRTPIRSRASLGPMDVHVGSSPTPHARRSQQVARDDSDVATPNAVRTIRLDDENGELGSSPPRFEKDAVLNDRAVADNHTPRDIVSDSFNYSQPGGSYSMSFDYGTALDEDLLPGRQLAEHQDDEYGSEDEWPTDIATTDLPSSTVELQLTAQLDAELNMQDDISANEPKNKYEESNNVYVDAASQPLQLNTTEADDGNDTEVEETQLEQFVATGSTKSKTRSSGTSRIGDSFSSQVPVDEPYDSQIQNVRRSSRVASSSPHSRASAKKRRQMSMDRARQAKKSKKQGSNPPSLFKAVENAEEAENTTVIEPPQTQSYLPFKAGSKRKYTGPPPQSQSNSVVVPGTAYKPSMLRTGSQLSQVENVSEDVMVEDTPAPKRARGRTNRDVSEAKTPTGGPGSHVKRFSHVQITPKSSSSLTELASSSAVRRIMTVNEDAEVIDVEQIPAQQDEIMQDETMEDSVTLDLDAVNPAASIKQEKAHAEAARQLERDTATSHTTPQSQSQVEAAVTTPTATPRHSVANRPILTPRSIINQFKTGLRDMLRNCTDMVLGRAEARDLVRELDDVMFDVNSVIHDAKRRGEEQQR